VRDAGPACDAAAEVSISGFFDSSAAISKEVSIGD